MSKRYFFLFLFAFIFSGINAQTELKFARYTTREGLVHNDVLSICQDSLGFMWFGTKGGFSRFDGVTFVNFKYDKFDDQSISGEWVNQITCDNQNRLWFAMTGKNNFVKYDYNSGRFEDMSEIIFEDRETNADKYIFWNLFADSKGLIWLPYVISYFNPNDSSVFEIKRKGTAYDYFEDPEGDVWIATINSGLYKYNRRNNSVSVFKDDSSNLKSLSSNKCHTVFIDSDNELWVGTNNGLNRSTFYLSDEPEFIKYYYDSENPHSISSNLVHDIEEDDNKRIFIATVNGLSVFDKKTDKIYRYYYDENDDESINSNLIRAIYKDRKNNIWIATDNGIAKQVEKSFKTFSHSKYKNSLSHNKVQDICEAPNGEIWIATPKGIDVYNRKTNQFSFITGVSTDGNGLYSAPLTITPDQPDGMWIGTWDGGVSHYDINEKRLINYLGKGFLGKVIRTFSIYSDSKNNFWFGSIDHGVYLINKENQKNMHFEKMPNSIRPLGIRYMMEDSDNDMWFATLDGLHMLIDIATGASKSYLNDLFIYHMCETKPGLIWAATNQGLFCLNKRTEKITAISYLDYLKSSVFSVIEDNNQNIWITTSEGCARLSVDYDSVTNITIYREEDGLNAGVFLPGSSAKLSDGTILLGGVKGFSMFNPSDVQEDTLSPIPLFTNLQVLGKEIQPGQEVNGQVILNKSIMLTKSLVLNHNNNAFSIEFAGLNCSHPRYNTFAYQLQGYEKISNQWHTATTNNPEVEYMNLPSGNYLFRLKVANSYGKWCEKPAEIKITILPPWWKTLWFTILWIGALVFSIFFIVKRRFQILKEQKDKLERIVTERTLELKEMNVILSDRQEELEIQMEEMSAMNSRLKAKSELISKMSNKIHEADQLKLRFFANISHEFRTPLTLIIGLLEKYVNIKSLAHINEWGQINNYLQIAHQNAKRLSRLVNQILDFRKIDQKAVSLKISNNNIIDFINDVVNAFLPMTEAKGVSLKFKSGNLLTDQEKNQKSQTEVFKDFWFDADVMEKILYNLISNAIKYTPKGGTVNVELRINNEQLKSENTNNDQLLTIHSSLLIKISDTGIGIEPENLDKIFDRFYREEKSDSAINEGTGIGLAYTKELVELHNGKISAKSEKNKGTSIVLIFPINEELKKEDKGSANQYSNLEYICSMVDDYTSKNQSSIEEYNELEVTKRTTNKTTETILLVEDNTDLRKFVKAELAEYYNIFEAKNGEEGLKTTIETLPDLIISDIMMPIMDGIEFCKEVRANENTSHIPVILLTAKEGDENILEGLKTGAGDYIIKPFNIDILKAKIHNLFELRRELQEKFNKSVTGKPSEVTHSHIDQKFLERAIRIVNENMNDYTFDNDRFVELMDYSRAFIYKKIKALTGQSLSEFIRNIRLKAGAKLFLDGSDNIAQVSYQVGFKHASDFSRYFRKLFNKSPKQFMQDGK